MRRLCRIAPVWPRDCFSGWRSPLRHRPTHRTLPPPDPGFRQGFGEKQSRPSSIHRIPGFDPGPILGVYPLGGGDDPGSIPPLADPGFRQGFGHKARGSSPIHESLGSTQGLSRTPFRTEAEKDFSTRSKRDRDLRSRRRLPDQACVFDLNSVAPIVPSGPSAYPDAIRETSRAIIRARRFHDDPRRRLA